MAIAALLLPGAASAALITLNGTMSVSADYGTEFIAGDTFDFSVTFDDATTDTNSFTFSAKFDAAVSAFTLVAGDANTGTWDPSGGIFNVAPSFKNLNVSANSDSVTFQADGSGFSDIGGAAFFDVGLTFNFPDAFDFVDTGDGQTFAQMVGTTPLDFSAATAIFAEIRNANFEGPSMTASLAPTAVPEPPVLALVLGGLLALTRRPIRRD